MFKLSNLLLLKLLIVVGYYVWLLCVIESSSFVEVVESVVEAVDCCRLHYVL